MQRTTARRRAAVPWLIAMAALLLASAVAAQRPPPPTFRIAAVKAMLFYGQTGTFSADLFGPSAPTLQNVSTGEGQAIATLVVVEIAGQPDTYAPARKVALTAVAGGRALLSRSVPIGRPGDDGRFHAAFWLYDTACTAVVIRARLTGQAGDSSVQKMLNFRCGD
ncbi:MAG: hypothetical protein ABI868_19715 [Acidobacteriota bacterium]